MDRSDLVRNAHDINPGAFSAVDTPISDSKQLATKEHTRWFAEEVRPHEPMLRAWLNRHFPSIGDLDDIIQEAYLKILQASIKNQLVSPKAFLFAITRNLALDHVRHRKVERVDHLAEIDDLAVMDRDRDVPETIAHAQELELLTEAIQSLPKRCRQIVTLRKIYGLPQKEVAAQLGISEHTVEAQGAIALRKISEFFARQDRQQLSKR